ncbi:MAG: NAD-dependent epimerase/dehydratase family protein [Acidimicrobiia bacterium]
MTGSGRVAVLGGAGFLGSHLVDRLVADGHGVLVVDDLSTGHLDNLADARRRGGVGFHSLSVDQNGFGAALARFAPSVVYLLADPDVPDGGAADPVGTVTRYVGRVAAMAETTRACEARLIIAASGLDLYGAVARQPIQERQRPHPLHARGAATYAALRYVEARLGRSWCALAMGTVYGGRQRPGSGVLADIVADMVRRHTPTVAGDPDASHDWLYVDDAVDALARACDSGTGLVNVGTGVATPLAEVVGNAADACSYLGKVAYTSPPAPEPAEFRLDPTHAGVVLGWQPYTPPSDGIAAAVTDLVRRLPFPS